MYKKKLYMQISKKRKKEFLAPHNYGTFNVVEKIFLFKKVISDIYKKIASRLCIKNERKLYQNRTLL
jgi:hypothetical protein